MGGIARHGNGNAEVAHLFKGLKYFEGLNVGFELPKEVVVVSPRAVALGKGIREKGDA